ncbi:MAG: hypothetical protein JWP74_1955 [Marmoricola sp.]|nr:hypothetical protein [Marmoricola sp.]
MDALLAATPLGLVARWSTRSQEQARRNAMMACTILTARRLERVQVEEFVAGHLARRTVAVEVAPAASIRHVS